MNERIRELIEQADIKFESHPQHQGIDTAVIIPTNLEKFAELIVQRCCEISDEAERADVPVFASKFIKAHFGVE